MSIKSNTTNLTTEEIILDLTDKENTSLEVQQEAGKRLQELLDITTPPVIAEVELSEKEIKIALQNEEERNAMYTRKIQEREEELKKLEIATLEE
jgi:uncharacterized protein (DUF169 family)